MQASTLAGPTDFNTGYGHSLCYEKQSSEKPGFYEFFNEQLTTWVGTKII